MAGRVANWYEHPETETGAWNYRVAVSVDPAAAGGAAADVSITVPVDYDHFWDNVQADGDDVRLVLSDGKTKTTYVLTTWTYASRIAVIEADAITMSPDDTILCLWLYYGNATATDGAGAPTIMSAKTGVIQLAGPGRPRIIASRSRPGATKPDLQIAKTTDETLFVWQRIDGLVSRRSRASAAKPGREAIVYAGYTVETGGAAQASMVDNDTIRFLETPDGAFWCRMTVKAGSDSTNYTLSPIYYTSTDTSAGVTADQVINPRALIKVRDVSE